MPAKDCGPISADANMGAKFIPNGDLDFARAFYAIALFISIAPLFLGKTFRGQFLLISGWHGILGRNVLHSLSRLLDGPSGEWMEQR